MFTVFNGDLPEEEFVRLLVYGATGAGKTTFGATMPGPRAVLAVDNNAAVPLKVSFKDLPRVLQNTGEVNRLPTMYVQAKTWDEILGAIDYLVAEMPKKGIVSLIVDSLTQIHDICKRETLTLRNVAYAKGQARANAKTIKVLEQLDENGWGMFAERMDQIRHRFNQVRVHLLYLAHSKPARVTTKDNITIVESVGEPDMQGKSSRLFPRDCSAVLYLEQLTDSTGNVVARVRAKQSNMYYAKGNTGRLDSIEPPDALIILARLGMLPESVAGPILEAAPVRTEDERQNEAFGFQD